MTIMRKWLFNRKDTFPLKKFKTKEAAKKSIEICYCLLVIIITLKMRMRGFSLEEFYWNAFYCLPLLMVVYSKKAKLFSIILIIFSCLELFYSYKMYPINTALGLKLFFFTFIQMQFSIRFYIASKKISGADDPEENNKILA